MDEKQTELMLARFGPIDALMDDLVKSGTVKDLVALPEPVFNVAMERIRRAHLERIGVRFLDPDNPATCETCEG
ncbi:MAG: hypothetical protein ABII93_06120 [Chrysiogenia bacterium]